MPVAVGCGTGSGGAGSGGAGFSGADGGWTEALGVATGGAAPGAFFLAEEDAAPPRLTDATAEGAGASIGSGSGCGALSTGSGRDGLATG